MSLHMKVGIRELKSHLSRYLGEVKKGKRIVVTDRGKEIAVLAPLSLSEDRIRRLIDERRASYKGGKPKGIAGVRVKGPTVAETILEDRR